MTAPGWTYEYSDFGYGYHASKKCKDVKLLVEADEYSRNQPGFKRGYRNFSNAIINRSLGWACETALRLLDGKLGLGPAVLVKKGDGIE